MYLSAFLAALAVLPLQGVLAGQFPVVNGVLGGVPTTVAKTFKPSDILHLSTAATTPGKLRVVENSGVCGLSEYQITNVKFCDEIIPRDDSWC
jgi:hypothetical protein